MPTQEAFKGNWNRIVGAVKEKFGEITGDDLMRVQGNLDKFVGLLQNKAGQSREQIEDFLSECCSEASSAFSRVTESAGNVASEATRYVRDGYETLTDRSEQGYEYARDVIERRPMESIAIAAGAGLVAGVLIGISLGSRR
jgi:uncharacterized protein YjbJ (UPF0337 family)